MGGNQSLLCSIDEGPSVYSRNSLNFKVINCLQKFAYLVLAIFEYEAFNIFIFRRNCKKMLRIQRWDQGILLQSKYENISLSTSSIAENSCIPEGLFKCWIDQEIVFDQRKGRIMTTKLKTTMLCIRNRVWKHCFAYRCVCYSFTNRCWLTSTSKG